VALGSQPGGSERSREVAAGSPNPGSGEGFLTEFFRTQIEAEQQAHKERSSLVSASHCTQGFSGEGRGPLGLQGLIGNSEGVAGRDPSSDRWRVEISSRERLEELLNECRLPTWDLEKFILAAIKRNNEAFDQARRLVKEGKGKGRYRSATWTAASILKGHPKLENLDPREAVRLMDQYLEPHGGWDVFPNTDVFGNLIDQRDSFKEAWSVIEKPLRCTPRPADALPLVNDFPLTSERWPSARDRGYRRSVSLCYWYSRLLGQEGRFFLSCRDAGELLGVSQKQAAIHLRWATREGFLRLLKKGSLWTGKASEYQVVGLVEVVGDCAA
jgi:hypothetical protein